MDVGALGAVARDAGGPIAVALVMASIILGIAGWLGKREKSQLDLLASMNDRLLSQLDAERKAHDATRVIAEAARMDAADARIERDREHEEAELARDAKRRAEALLAEEVMRRSTAEHIAREVEAMKGVRHKRSADGNPGDGL